MNINKLKAIGIFIFILELSSFLLALAIKDEKKHYTYLESLEEANVITFGCIIFIFVVLFLMFYMNKFWNKGKKD